MGDYRDWIAKMREMWVGKKVVYDGTDHTVVDVDYNGMLLIDLPGAFTDTTAVGSWMVK